MYLYSVGYIYIKHFKDLSMKNETANGVKEMGWCFIISVPSLLCALCKGSLLLSHKEVGGRAAFKS